MTFLESVSTALLRASRYNAADAAAPIAVIWTDPESQWMPLLPRLSAMHQELLTCGQYDPAQRMGPSIWLRCAIEGTIADVHWPDDRVPIIYLPGVCRQDLRETETCPFKWQPLSELLFRGTSWIQKNGRDWTIEAYLVSPDGGLALDVAQDTSTKKAALGALESLADVEIHGLTGRRLEASDFDTLLVQDFPRDLLLWLGDPSTYQAEWSGTRWDAFSSQCTVHYNFDPDRDGVLVAGELLGKREKDWMRIWDRFIQAPVSFPGIEELLRKSKPSGEMVFTKETWPDENEEEEHALSKALLGLAGIPAADARKKLLDLEAHHSPRRGWVWARLGNAPLACALEHLTVLAKESKLAPGGDSLETLRGFHTTAGYRVDDSVLRALSSISRDADARAVIAAITAVYNPWLESSALHFQKLFRLQPSAFALQAQQYVEASPGDLICFVDGLRYDLGMRLAVRLEEKNNVVTVHSRWAAIPTVTPTAKPGVSPVAPLIIADSMNDQFQLIDSNKRTYSSDTLHKLMRDAGYQVFNSDVAEAPLNEDSRGWTEYGEFDRLGHNLNWKLAAFIDDQLDQACERIVTLLAKGWKRVRIVTDHGWLLVPSGLPSTSLPKYLTQSRWSRCASIQHGAQIDTPTAAWSWNTAIHFAYPDGVCCYSKGNTYAHGGLSVQECLTPDLIAAQPTGASSQSVKITKVSWHGMRCTIEIEGFTGALFADLRTKAGDENTSISGKKQFDMDGRVSLLAGARNTHEPEGTGEEDLEGVSVLVVILDERNSQRAKRSTIVGGEH
jgi:hypothetical protein